MFLDRPVIGGFRVLPETDPEETLAVIIDDISDFPAPLARELGFVAREDHPLGRMLAEIVGRKVFRDKLTLPMPRSQRDHQARDPPLLHQQEEVVQ